MSIPLTFEDNQFEYQPAGDLDSGTPPDEPHPEHRSSKPNGAVQEHERSVARTSTEQVMDMVDDLVGPESAGSNPRSPVHEPESAQGVNSGNHSPRPTSGAFTASDLVRQISQGSPANIFSTPSQQPPFGLGQDPFSPLLGEFGGSISGSRPGTSHQTTSPRLGYHRSSGFFSDELARRQREIDTRTSPLISMEPSSVSQSPMYGYAQNRSRASLQQDHWQSPFTSPPERNTVSRQAAMPARFGAIGDSRPAATRTPPSGQAG